MSKTLNFIGAKETNLFHLLKEKNKTSDGQILKGNATITGFTKQAIENGDVLNINGTKYIVETVKRRNHAGAFVNPEDKIGTFFQCETSFERLIVSK